MTRKEVNARYYEKKKNSGLCVQCGKVPPADGKTLCESCLLKLRNYSKDTRKFFKDLGLCPRCGKNKLFGDEKECPECTAKEYEVTMRSRNSLGKDHYNSVHSEWSKNNHRKLIEQGICTRCGKRKADYGYKTCGICRSKIRNYNRIKYGKPDRSERYKQGLCFFCDNPVKSGYKVCEKHYQMNVEKANTQKAKEARENIIKSGILY